MVVTGAAGFIGSHLVERLLGRGDTVIGIDNFNDYYDPARKRANVRGLVGHERCTLHEADLCDEAAIERIIGGARPRSIAHLGAYGGVRYSIGRAKLYTQANIVGTVNVLEAAREAEVETFVFASTSSVYGHTTRLPFVESDPCNEPLAPYPASKKACEVLGYTYHNLHGMNFTAVRFFSVYGPRGRPDMMPFMSMHRIVRDEAITLYDGGELKRDWTYVDDIVSGVVSAMDRPVGYQVVNLGRGEPVVMSDFIEIIEKLTGRRAKLHTPPAPASEPRETFANIDKARRLLDYHPATSVEQGLTKMWAWYQREVTEGSGAGV